MNRAFYIIVVPAVATSFGWIWFGWGLRPAVIVTGVELVVGIAAVVWLARRQNAEKASSEASR
ncbi:MAG: hypothetical protein ACRD59_00460 [Candidatus Acidiferrales bacterium]